MTKFKRRLFFFKINSSSIKNQHAQFQYVHNMSAKFEKHSLNTIRGVDYTNLIPYYAKQAAKMTKLKGCN